MRIRIEWPRLRHQIRRALEDSAPTGTPCRGRIGGVGSSTGPAAGIPKIGRPRVRRALLEVGAVGSNSIARAGPRDHLLISTSAVLAGAVGVAVAAGWSVVAIAAAALAPVGVLAWRIDRSSMSPASGVGESFSVRPGLLTIGGIVVAIGLADPALVLYSVPGNQAATLRVADVAALALALWGLRWVASTLNWYHWLLVAGLVWGGVVGALVGDSLVPVLSESRAYLVMVGCAAAVAYSARMFGPDRVIRAAWYAIIGALALGLVSKISVNTGGPALVWGRVTPAPGSLERVIDNSDALAPIVLTVLYASVLLGRRIHRWYTSLPLAVVACAVIFLSFGRRHIVALCVGVLAAHIYVLLRGGGARNQLGLAINVLAVTAGLVGVVAVASLSGNTGDVTQDSFRRLESTTSVFATRAIAGLDQEVSSAINPRDSRRAENRVALRYVTMREPLGIGLGSDWVKPELRSELPYKEATRLVHNSYLHAALKGGPLLGVGLVLFLLGPLVRRLRGREGIQSSLDFVPFVVLVQLIVIAWFVPLTVGVTLPVLTAFGAATYYAQGPASSASRTPS
jgi:hypothetical protein